MFAGKREAVELPAKRGPGRPPKQREEEVEEPDAVLEAVRNMPDQPEAYDEHLGVRHRKRLREEEVEAPLKALLEASGETVGGLRMPGAELRDNTADEALRPKAKPKGRPKKAVAKA